MYRARRTLVATGLVALLAIAGVTAAIAADPAPPPPPRIAFLANGIVPADALAAGPIAGQLGAPVYTTRQETLSPDAADALTAYNPELVVVMGGPVAISDAVVNQVAAATGLPAVDPSPTPTTGVVRAAGGDRFETAAIVADLLAAYSPAYLPVDDQAVDSALLEGRTAAELVAEAQSHTMWALLNPTNNATFGFSRQSGEFSDGVRLGVGDYTVQVDRDISECSYQATIGNTVIGDAGAMMVSVNTNQFDDNQLIIRTFGDDGTPEDVLNAHGIHLLVNC